MENNDLENIIPKPEQSSPYTVPENYFNSLQGRIMERIRLEEEPSLSIPGLDNKNPFITPDNYFSSLSKKIHTQLGAEEDSIDLSIPSPNNHLPFTIPEGYFDTLSTTVEEKIFSDIALNELKNANNTFIKRFYRLTMAACFALLCTWFGYNVYQTSRIDRQMNSSVNVVKIDNHNFDLNYFDESMLIEEVINKPKPNEVSEPEKTGKLENYILNNIDEELLLQEL
ncbi:hypothetical protein [Solitalea lacus]|uniref:hypothetical protein n=1 Tax=Solitalea lacus TaxID=2911172 RepID=UPI001EDA8E02|nr:hypothetical protein [Solitalea lacus]UKJ08839.1 hypothetical protein L2B55_06635 [Solitalea lacus]